ncbi:MAG: hypothetical protein HQK79_20955 [Desulfobacterales bacterium]|nr:hypothetical protein [Desulfobacterales bacterium]
MAKNFKIFSITLLFILGLALLANAEQTTLTSTIGTASDGRSAVPIPAEFTVPVGKIGVIIDYFWENATGKEPRKSNRLGNYQIFNFNTAKHIPISYDQNGKATTTLSPGKYSFKVDGYPGASGKLTIEFKDSNKKSGIGNIMNNLKNSTVR